MDLKQVVDKYRQPKQAFDWEPRKQKWLSELTALLGQIRAMLGSAGIPDSEIQSTPIEITEESLGTYSAPQLILSLGGRKVLIQPIASVILGGYGRVDIKGPDGTVKIIAEDRDDLPNDKRPAHERDWLWRIYDGRQSIPFESDTFADALQRVIGEP